MKLHSLLAGVALAGVLGLAHAADPVTLSPGTPGVLSGGFTQSVDGLFVDTFSFTPVSFDGLVSVTLTSLAGPVSFFTASLNDQDFSFFPELGSLFDVSFQARVTSATPLTLTVFGAVLDADGNPGGSGAYTGTITAAVPEPQTYALLLAGLGVVGFAARQRRRSEPTQA